MNNELISLENKVEQLIALCATLRKDNHRLQDRVLVLEDEKQGLADRMTEARTRLEGLMDRLPAE